MKRCMVLTSRQDRHQPRSPLQDGKCMHMHLRLRGGGMMRDCETLCSAQSEGVCVTAPAGTTLPPCSQALQA
jgi:hypothetical protein